MDFNKRNNRGIGIYLVDKYKNAIVFDTDATVSISNDRNDFISWDKKRDCQSLRGVTEEAKVQGFGIVEWKISDVGGRHQTIKTQYCYVPDAAVRLFSPQAFFVEGNKGDS